MQASNCRKSFYIHWNKMERMKQVNADQLMTTTAIARHELSKSTFMRGCQCIKSLWMHKFSPELKDEMDLVQQAIFAQGTNVGEIARELFPGGVDASPVDSFHYQQSVSDTKALIEAGEQVIYEAAFQYEGVLAAIDILVRKNGKWYAYEVKSSTSVKEPFIQDAALQYHVITKAGIALQDIFLIHINNKYVRKGSLEIEKLFTRQSLKKEVLQLQPFIEAKLTELKAVIRMADVPLVEPGPQCKKPYTCDFYGHCWKDAMEMRFLEKENIDRHALKIFLNELRFPLYYMDFETYMLAVPEFDGHWPYRQVPFQFSIHKQAHKTADPSHAGFLASNGCDPCPEFVESLLAALGERGSILVWNLTFENSRLNELKKDYPKYANAIQNIQDRMVDLMVPFRKKHFYLPAMNGSYSIKNVLPALVPEMSYDGMAINNGADASTAFYNLRFENDGEKVAATRKALLKYCEQDTMAMVRILEKMRESVS
jgi:hypothetical protein